MGKLISNYLRERIFAEYTYIGSYKEVAKKFGVGESTVKELVTKYRDDFNEIREQKKQEMVREIWGNLMDAQKLGHKYIQEALAGEREIPLNHVSNYFGTMYDKQALMMGDKTQNIGHEGIQVVFNMPDVSEDDEKWKEAEVVEPSE